jgi:hypothetical protein
MLHGEMVFENSYLLDKNEKIKSVRHSPSWWLRGGGGGLEKEIKKLSKNRRKSNGREL